MSEVCGIILAAGEGKRMKSNLPKVLSRVLDKPMLKWVIDAARGAGIEALCVVDGFKREEVERYLATLPEAYETAFQAERKGTAHAVMQARGFLERHRDGDVLILNGDAPFLDEKTIRRAYRRHREGNHAVTLISAYLCCGMKARAEWPPWWRKRTRTRPRRESGRSAPALTGSKWKSFWGCFPPSGTTTPRGNIICRTR